MHAFGECSCVALMQGNVVNAKPWFNLSMQSLQPLFQIADRVKLELVSGVGNTSIRLSMLHAAISHVGAFEGGGCLHFSGQHC